MPNYPRFQIENANIMFSNFSGRPGKYNPPGVRSFVVEVPQNMVKQLVRDGFNVRYTKPKEEGDEPKPMISIAVRFDKRPPTVIMLTDTSRIQLDESTVEVLDWADIKTVDLIATGSTYNVGDNSGLKAYTQALFVTINESELDRKYQIYENPPSKA